MKLIYWQMIKKITDQDGSVKWRVEYWTKPDRSNAISDIIHSLNEDQLRRRIEFNLGIRKFELRRVE